MLFQKARALHHAIEEKRKNLYEIFTINGISNSYTIHLSQQLELEITELQKLMGDVKEESKRDNQKEIIFELEEKSSYFLYFNIMIS